MEKKREAEKNRERERERNRVKKRREKVFYKVVTVRRRE